MDSIRFVNKFRYDKIKFIKLVEQHPCLWDSNCKEFRNAVTRRTAWQEICRRLDKSYDNMTTEDKEKTRRSTVQKWENLRDAFKRSLKLEHTSLRPYYAGKYLNFLNGQMNRIKSEPNSDVEDNTTNEDLITLQSSGYDDNLKSPNVSNTRDKYNKFFSTFLHYMQDFNDDEKLDLHLEIIRSIKKIKQNRSKQLPQFLNVASSSSWAQSDTQEYHDEEMEGTDCSGDEIICVKDIIEQGTKLVHTKWINIRDSFVRYLKNIKSMRPYYARKHLKFLLKLYPGQAFNLDSGTEGESEAVDLQYIASDDDMQPVAERKSDEGMPTKSTDNSNLDSLEYFNPFLPYIEDFNEDEMLDLHVDIIRSIKEVKQRRPKKTLPQYRMPNSWPHSNSIDFQSPEVDNSKESGEILYVQDLIETSRD